MNSKIDINSDLGEGFPDDARILDLVSSASISCGAHAGDPDTILATLEVAKRRGVAVGAHPGYPDREGFGRIERSIPAAEVEAMILDQFATLERYARATGVVLRFVKPHGALYNQAQRDPETARGVVDAMVRLGLPVLGQPGSVLSRLATGAGVRYVAEGFPDRRYAADGTLVPRNQPDAVLHDPSELKAQVVRLLDAGFETLCLHGDDPRAVSNAERVREVLEGRGVVPRFWR